MTPSGLTLLLKNMSSLMDPSFTFMAKVCEILLFLPVLVSCLRIMIFPAQGTSVIRWGGMSLYSMFVKQFFFSFLWFFFLSFLFWLFTVSTEVTVDHIPLFIAYYHN